MARRLLSALLFVLFILSLAALVAPGVCHALTPPADGKWLMTVALTALAAEKVWAMFFRMRSRYSPAVEHDWTSVSVGYAYGAVVYAAILDYYLPNPQAPKAWIGAVGLVIYLAAVALRYWAFHHLRHQWAIHVDKPIGDRRLISDGPYKWIRHPLYTGAFLETLGLPLLVGSWIALAVALLVFFPLETQRTYFEERYLRRIFGDTYDRYVARTWAFLPLPFGKDSDAIEDGGNA